MNKYKRIINFLFNAVIIGVLAVGFSYVWFNYYSQSIFLPFYRRGNWMLIAIYVVITYLFFKIFECFKIGHLRRTDLIYSQFIANIFVNIFMYAIICLIGREWMDVMPMTLLTITDMFLLIIWTFCTNRIFQTIFSPRKLLIIYGNKNAEKLVSKMSAREDKYIITNSISEYTDFDKIISEVKNYDGVILSELSPQFENKILKTLFSESVRTYISPKISDIILRGAENIRLFDTPLLLCRNYGLTFEQRLSKRIFDILFSLFCIAILLIPMLIVGACIFITDFGSPFYVQKRLTQDGKVFGCLKFRSMIKNAESKTGAILSEKDDPRITPIGKFIRKIRFDEVPQFFNILIGDMSVIGPRPERPEIAAEYEKDMCEWSFRLKVKAGLSGYSQVVGLYDTTPYDKLRMDLIYIENYSFVLDLQILLMTIRTVLMRKG
ncbi:MAG: exopolysaccharide biosynthesis polyprenyl glycosylphosphotransferase [Ruminococcus sp.]|jgi:exopolysaccharide biosynthesis polyprenyl glycosylphosphotransferase|nr:exopolysaccharide biosynthesis polyprenyl glycosylphosphotransferase [Ruminococcus sp.]